MSITIEELMSKMPAGFDPEKAAGLVAVIQFKFTGEQPGEWYADVNDGKVDVKQGAHPNPKMTLSADSADFLKLTQGELDPMQAFMQGKLKLSGDMSLAMKMAQLFKMG